MAQKTKIFTPESKSFAELMLGKKSIKFQLFNEIIDGMKNIGMTYGKIL